MKSIFEQYAENINYYQAPGMPGNKIVIFENGNVYTDEEPTCCNQKSIEEYINNYAIPWAFLNGIYLRGIDHGNFVRIRSYCPSIEVPKKKEEDYSLNVDILNYVHSVMVASEEHAKGKHGITVIEYVGEADQCIVQEFKDKIEFEEYVKEYLEEIKEEE